MKKNIIFAIITAVSLLLLPLTSFSSGNTAITPAAAPISQEEEIKASETFRLLLNESGKIEEIDADEYVFGVVAAEMPVLYEEEALKAQAIAAYTFALRRKLEATEKDYDISDNFKTDQAYISKEEAAEKWGEKADEYTKKLETIVKSVSGRYLSFEGEPALCVYHAVSCGVTENAEDIWGNKTPYLVSVESRYDLLAPNYSQTFTFSTDEFKEKLSSVCEMGDDISKWLGPTERSGTGRVESITICGKKITGEELRNALVLPSNYYEITFQDNQFTIHTKGYGHGVGMSQNAANEMAKRGCTHKEILSKYYPDCTLQK